MNSALYLTTNTGFCCSQTVTFHIWHTVLFSSLGPSGALTVGPKGLRSFYSQLSISRVQFCSSRGYLRRSIIHAAVVVILEKRTHMGEERRQGRIFEILCGVCVDRKMDGNLKKKGGGGVRLSGFLALLNLKVDT